MTKSVNGTDAAEKELEGVKECFHPVVKEYGRDMFSFIYTAGMAQQAAEQVGSILQQVNAPRALAGLRVLGTAFNQTGQMLAEAKGWDGERLGECEAAILRAASPVVLVH